MSDTGTPLNLPLMALDGERLPSAKFNEAMHLINNYFGALHLDLIAFWNLDEASGTRNDALGANHLTDNNTVTQDTGKIGSAAQFTAANSEFLSIADNTNMSTGDIDFTFAGWVYLDTKGAVRDICTKWGASGQFEYILLYNNTPDRFEFYVSNNGTATVAVTASTLGSPATGTWYFLVAYHDSVNNLIGISGNNGGFNTAAHTTGVFNSTSPFQFGAKASSPSYHNGRLDAWGFWKRVLTSNQITILYNAGAGLGYPF